ncbi:MAG: RND transporter [Syntrophobacteraceae bacterium CG2_30_61_12]|nr:MAG: RND transporter [Syntrophobacteraceae bacterium CG2_30_61_12]
MSTVNKSASWLLMAILVTTFTGCAAVGLDYKRPDVPVYEDWHTRLDGKANPESLAEWWTTFNDTKLTHLIERAVKGNLDLKKAWAQVRAARARRGFAESGLIPSLSGSDSVTWTHTIDNGAANVTSGSGSELYSANLDASWELDVFGGVRRSVEAAQGDLQASDESLRNVLVSLLSEVALNYFDVRTYQDRLEVAANNLESQSETYQLTQWRYQAGLADELAVQQARYNLESTRSQIPVLRTGLDAAMNRIAVLLGEQPGAVHDELDHPEPILAPALQVAVGVPADLLRRRPDVRQAERELAAQTARIGVATADLYPKLTLSGSIGLETLSLKNLPSGTVALSGGPSITWAIFKGGAIRQNIKLQSALQEEALVHYESVILGALEEVENALRAYVETQEHRKSLGDATQAAQKTAELAQQKYQAGLTDFTSVLDAQRSLLSLQEQLAISNGNVSANLVRVYKAVGGGWTSLSGNPETDRS